MDVPAATTRRILQGRRHPCEHSRLLMASHYSMTEAPAPSLSDRERLHAVTRTYVIYPAQALSG